MNYDNFSNCIKCGQLLSLKAEKCIHCQSEKPFGVKPFRVKCFLCGEIFPYSNLHISKIGFQSKENFLHKRCATKILFPNMSYPICHECKEPLPIELDGIQMNKKGFSNKQKTNYEYSNRFIKLTEYCNNCGYKNNIYNKSMKTYDIIGSKVTISSYSECSECGLPLHDKSPYINMFGNYYHNTCISPEIKSYYKIKSIMIKGLLIGLSSMIFASFGAFNALPSFLNNIVAFVSIFITLYTFVVLMFHKQ